MNRRVTLDEAVGEVLNHLTGLDLHYVAELDRYRSITRFLNRALRLTATEKEWSYYASLEELGTVHAGQTSLYLRGSRRPRMITDDSVRLVDAQGCIRTWAFWMKRESLSKYQGRAGLWVASVRNEVQFSRPISQGEEGLRALAPVMRDPVEFQIPATLESVEDIQNPPDDLPAGADLIQLRNFHNPDIVEEWVFVPGLPPYQHEDPEGALEQLQLTPDQIRNQILDFEHPDLVILRAAAMYAAADPVLQPRVQALEAGAKDLFYSLSERDENHTDEPYRNDWQVPIQSSLNYSPQRHNHPHSDERTAFDYR